MGRWLVLYTIENLPQIEGGDHLSFSLSKESLLRLPHYYGLIIKWLSAYLAVSLSDPFERSFRIIISASILHDVVTRLRYIDYERHRSNMETAVLLSCPTGDGNTYHYLNCRYAIYSFLSMALVTH